MQYHLNGYKSGSPDIAPSENHAHSNPNKVDVLIVGCGPAGLTLAVQLSAFPDIAVRILDSKPGPLTVGQADGIACRSMEMFEAFGFADKVRREAYWVNETVFWRPDGSKGITRTGRIQDVEDGLSEQPHTILNQARVHDFYLEIMKNAPNRLNQTTNKPLFHCVKVISPIIRSRQTSCAQMGKRKQSRRSMSWAAMAHAVQCEKCWDCHCEVLPHASFGA